MLEPLGLPRPQIATKLYGAIALALAVVYLLGAATIQFAGRTEEVHVRVGPTARVLDGRVEGREASVGSDEEASPRAWEDVLEGDGEVEVLRHAAPSQIT